MEFSELKCGNGGHYSIYKSISSMELLQSIFPNAQADEMNFCLFSVSGVHGTYQTIEDEESEPGTGVTFLIIKPRIVSMLYGIVYPQSPDDFDFLKRLRRSSKNVVSNHIG